ncbi:hypothetical protein GOP56_00625 [Brevibacillus sp. 7WMA2]|nr:hypothetical protein C0R09_07990 [Brevibacillus laterosporus]MBA4533461.1 hypothetical protein [Brevibacillus halotolerans]QIC04233.1 hypothetical protein GOP56_00625 [Brevibacillus sp. 7WMA2]
MVLMEGGRTRPEIWAIGRREPSKEALDRFIEIYLDILTENERKGKEVAMKAEKDSESSDS